MSFPSRQVPGAAFLLTRVGAHSSRLWRERMAKLGMDPRHVMLLGLVAEEEGRSQLALGRQMGTPPSRMVAFVDELEALGMLERHPNPMDRRMRTLYLTVKGRQTLEGVKAVSAEHERQITRGLTQPERKELIRLLGKVATEQGLVAGD
ncbi:hypothetical protein BH23ACT12_BH23ACT12_07520 [soil metagenome]